MTDYKYSDDEISRLRNFYDPLEVRTWPYYPITMKLKNGQGPASDKECDKIEWEVWDRFCNSFGSFEYLPDAINDAMKRTKELFND